MEIKFLKYPGDDDWLDVRNAALSTRREESDVVPSSELRKKFLMSEHTPIRLLVYTWDFIDIEYWVAMHFRTHHEGLLHFISSQRNDVQKQYDRRKAPQDAPVNYRVSANAQAILNISKARLCLKASKETRQAWEMFVEELGGVSPELASLCVPHCVYRGGICPEVFSSCEYNNTSKFLKELKVYEDGFTLYE
jgi:hypothetical protein